MEPRMTSQDFKQPDLKKKPLVLIVDDVPKNIQVVAGVLSQIQIRMAVAQNASQAFEILERISPDLILLDVMLPDIDGFEICRRLKESPVHRDIPVIFLTAKVDPLDLIQGFEAGAIDYVVKPFNPLELKVRVQTQLELKRARDAQKELITELQRALDQVKLLSGMIPMCSSCKKVRDDAGYWKQVEEYIESRSEALVSHGLCPECVRNLYPEIAEEIIRKRDPSA
jgi:PleD family two-component response regulator